jgi:hypothetical protein
MQLGIRLTNERAATLRFDQFPQFAHDRLLAAMQEIEQRLEAAIIAQEPTKTGALRSWTGGRVYDHGNRIAAVVGVRAPSADAAKKAAALEYGSHKALTVRAHTARLAHFWSRAVPEIMVVHPAYSRTPNVDDKRFLRDPAEMVRGDAMGLLQAAVDQAAEDLGR